MDSENKSGLYETKVTFYEQKESNQGCIEITPPNVFNKTIRIETNPQVGSFDCVELTQEQWVELVDFVNSSLPK